MKIIDLLLNAGTGALTFYVMPPCRGTVKSLKAVFGTAVAVGDTVDVQRSSTSVNLATTTVTTVGVPIEGTPDTTNKGLIFDPDSDTAANKVLKIVVSALESANTLTHIMIEFDDSAYVAQAASEA